MGKDFHHKVLQGRIQGHRREGQQRIFEKLSGEALEEVVLVQAMNNIHL